MLQSKPNLSFPIERWASIEHAPTNEENAVRFMHHLIANAFLSLRFCNSTASRHAMRDCFGISILSDCVLFELFELR